MTTALTLHQAQTPALLDRETLSTAVELADRVASTEFVPTAMRNRPEAVVACILKGAEVGVGPMQALAMIDIIDGRPAMRAELQRALVMRAGHRIWVQESTDTRATVCGARGDEQRTDAVTWTLDDARRAVLLNKQNWQKYPRAMLVARATAELCRRQFADVLGGIPAVEEIDDAGADTAGTPPATSSAPTRRRLTRGGAQAAAVRDDAGGGADGDQQPDAEQPEAPPSNVVDIPAREVVAPAAEAPSAPDDPAAPETTGTHAQRIAIAARELGVDRAHVILAATGGRKSSGRALTDAEGRGVLELLRRIKVGEAAIDVDDEGGPRIVDRVAPPPLELDRQAVEAALGERLPRVAPRERLASLITDAELLGEDVWRKGEALAAFLQRIETAKLGRLLERVDELLREDAAVEVPS